MIFPRFYVLHMDLFGHRSRFFSSFPSMFQKFGPILNTENAHCYKTLFPWKNISDLTEYLASTIVYNKDGLIAINKPFGIKIHGHDKPGTRSKVQKHYSPLPECDLTIEDSLNGLKQHLNVENLTILRSAEKYTSGIVLLSTNNKVSAAVKKSFNVAKFQKIPPLTHWMLTLGYPVVSYRKERVGIKFEETESGEPRQPEIVTEFSKRDSKLKKVHPVYVEYRMLSVNKNVPASLVEISTSSVKWYFVRVYAVSRVAAILGDFLYSGRQNTLLGMPVMMSTQQVFSFNIQPLPQKIAESLMVPKGMHGHSTVPVMLHLRSIFLPSFMGKDVTVTAEPPPHFRWTLERLNLLYQSDLENKES